MKKIFLTLLLVLIAASFSYAGTSDSADGVLAFPNADPAVDDIALSPKVSAQYTDGTNAAGVANQWYVAGTTHDGGNFTYATAAGITKIYKKTNGSNANMFADMPTSANSEEDWSTDGWSL